jgi:hypothetical protein
LQDGDQPHCQPRDAGHPGRVPPPPQEVHRDPLDADAHHQPRGHHNTIALAPWMDEPRVLTQEQPAQDKDPQHQRPRALKFRGDEVTDGELWCAKILSSRLWTMSRPPATIRKKEYGFQS